MTSLAISQDGDAVRLVALGDWTIDNARAIDQELRRFVSERGRPDRLDIALGDVRRVDTTGAWLIVRTKAVFDAAGVPTGYSGLTEERRILIDAVAARRPDRVVAADDAPDPLTKFLEETGANTKAQGRDALESLGFFGEIAKGFAALVRRPSSFRLASVMTHVERMGLQAVPIVGLMSFLIGGIIAQQGAVQLRVYGAEVFVVNLVGILVLREVGLLLAAIMIAGRSGSATTAEIGSMRMREEIDAMRVMGIDPIQVLVIPRLIALVIALPLVTIVSNFAALLGALVTSWLYIGIDPAAFLSQLRNAITPTHILIGLVKAPVMAVIIGIIACLEGLRVRGSTESLGLHTTASVVKAIFMVIVVDGLFAVIFAALDI